jgi:hypothetical protein
MDPASTLLGAGLGLLTGLLLGWQSHALASRRDRENLEAVNELERLDRCSEVFAARAKYVVAYHTGRGAHSYLPLRDVYKGLQRRYRYADPELVLKGTAVWADYRSAERAARDEETGTLAERVAAYEAASMAVTEEIARRRLAAVR